MYLNRVVYSPIVPRAVRPGPRNTMVVIGGRGETPEHVNGTGIPDNLRGTKFL